MRVESAQHVEGFLYLASGLLVAGATRHVKAATIDPAGFLYLSGPREHTPKVVIGGYITGIARNHLLKLVYGLPVPLFFFKLKGQSIARKRIVRVCGEKLFQHVPA